MMIRLSTLALATWFALPNTVQANTIYIHAGKLITAEQQQPLTEHTIIVVDDKITDVKAGYLSPSAAATLIDLRNHTVLPGLMDMHTHFSTQISATSYGEAQRLNEADFALRGAVFAEKTLMAGFTTVRELGDSHHISVALRKAIAQGYVKGPRIYAAGKSLATTGGHADPTNGLAYALLGDPGPKQGVINGADDARKAVRQRYKEGADLIKVTDRKSVV